MNLRGLVENCPYGYMSTVGVYQESNMKIIQQYKNKILRNITNAPRYFSNRYLHRDLQMDTVNQTIEEFPEGHEQRFLNYVNVEAPR